MMTEVAVRVPVSVPMKYSVFLVLPASRARGAYPSLNLRAFVSSLFTRVIMPFGLPLSPDVSTVKLFAQSISLPKPPRSIVSIVSPFLISLFSLKLYLSKLPT